MTAEPILEATRVSAGYGDIGVLREVSARVWPGKLTALLGSNGTGKTTTLRTLSGLNRATEGTVRLLGQDVTRLAPEDRTRKGLAYVMEGKRLFHRRTVEDNLLLGGYSVTRSKKTLRRRAETMYERFEVLGERKKSRAGDLSGGQQQMLAIAQALMAEPKVLLLDEPSGGLAPIVVRQVMDIVAGLKDGGLGVLLVEQAAAEAVRVADHVLVLNTGRVVLDQPASGVDLEEIRQAYLG